ncbi:MAG: SDR family oxidoreductase [Isosphaeraceae bacterium]
MRVVLTGASGQLGAYLYERLQRAGDDVRGWSGRSREGEGAGGRFPSVELTDEAETARALEEADPAVIVHAAAVSTAEGVRRDPARGRAVNVEATARLARWCATRGRRFVYISSDLVFDGSRPWSREDDPAAPVLAYGQTKRDAEPFALEAPGGLVARLSLLYGPSRSGRISYYDRTIEGLRRGEPQTFFEDEFRTPLDLRSAAEAIAGLVERQVSGPVHVGGRERISRYDLARRTACALGLDASLVRSNRQADMSFPEPRPADVSLDTTRLAGVLPDLDRPRVEEAVRRMTS